MKTLSSFVTLAWKTAVPAILIGAIVLAIYSGIEHSELPRAPLSYGGLLFGVVMLAVITVLLVRFAACLKTVELDGDHLWVTNYVARCNVPLAMIERVTEIRFVSPSTVTLHLRCDTPFGRKIIFIPRTNLGTLLHPRRVADEIRALAESAGNAMN